MLRAALSRPYRNENAVLGPVMLLYITQLEDASRALWG